LHHDGLARPRCRPIEGEDRGIDQDQWSIGALGRRGTNLTQCYGEGPTDSDSTTPQVHEHPTPESILAGWSIGAEGS
jgi:hypothetical protein